MDASAGIKGNIERLIHRTCQALDDEKFDEYLGCCDKEFGYEILAYSPELRKDQTWLKHTRDELFGLFKMLPQHVRMSGKFWRQATIASIEPAERVDYFTVRSSIMVVYTEPEGVSRLFAVGRYEDKVLANGEAPVLLSRKVRLDTRDLSPGAHVPM